MHAVMATAVMTRLSSHPTVPLPAPSPGLLKPENVPAWFVNSLLVSLSHPDADAAAVLAFCLASGGDMEVVAGGRIPRGRDAWEYVPVPRYQIEIQSDQPVWLLQLRGQYIHPTPSGAPAGAGIEQDPLCIVGPRFPGYIHVRGYDSSAITRSLPSPAP